MQICETIDSSDCESIEKIIKVLANAQLDNEVLLQNKMPLSIHPNGLHDLSEQMLEYLRIESYLNEKEIERFIEALTQLSYYLQEANIINSVIEKYLETRAKDNYREILYKDSIQLIQLRQEKVFMIQLLILSMIGEEVENNESFHIFLDCLQKSIKLHASIKFGSLTLKSREIIQHGLTLIEETKYKDRLELLNLLPLERQSSKKSMMSSMRKTSFNNMDQNSQNYTSTMKWLLIELQNNQILCRELIPNLRFIIKNYTKQFVNYDPKRMTKGSIFDLKSRLRLGGQGNKVGIIDLPSIGPLDSIIGTQLSKNSINEYLDDDQLKQCQMAIMQIDNQLNGDLLKELAGTDISEFESELNESSLSNPSQLSQSFFRTFRPGDNYFESKYQSKYQS